MHSRRTARLATALLILTAALWTASGRWYVWGITQSYALHLGHGGVAVVVIGSEPQVSRGWTFSKTSEYRLDFGASWLAARSTSGPASTALPYLRLPIWPLVLALAALCALIWKHRLTHLHRIRRGACLACGYDRRGTDARSPCPECGQPHAGA